ncbi:hypothetical protein U0D24_21610 [Hafnia paralvei]|jgi:hypothetical protein|uniref:hypothetical protein n=1 Tax=Hafnia paralvei TaxID=546367 RepID=UPI002FDC3B3C
MNAIKLTINGRDFLLPETHSDYPSGYLEDHKELIIRYIESETRLLDLMANEYGSESYEEAYKRVRFLTKELANFKEVTGIIGHPFDARDVGLYIIDKNVTVVLQLAL